MKWLAAHRWFPLLLLGHAVFTNFSFAQNQQSNNEALPASVGMGSEIIAEEEVLFSEDQQLRAAEYFITEQKRITDDAIMYSLEYEEKREALLYRLARERISAFEKAKAMPARNPIEKLRKVKALAEFSDVNEERLKGENAESHLYEIAVKHYERRVLRGERIEDLSFVIPGVVRVEPSTIDKIRVTKVVDEKSGILIVVLPKSIPLNSKHLEQYLHRALLLGNRGKGRPVVFIQGDFIEINEEALKNGSFKYRYYDKPLTRAQKLKSWWKANYMAPDPGNTVLTGLSVAFGVGVTEGIEGMKYLFNDAYVWNHTPTIANAVYGTLFGLWGSFYTNITSPGDPNDPKSRARARNLRMIIGSGTFSYALQIANSGIGSISLLTSAGWLTNASLFLNMKVNAIVKDGFRWYNDMRLDMGLSRGNVKIFGVDVKKSGVERQAMYQVPNFIRMLSLTGFKVGNIPVGDLIFYSSYWWNQYLLVKYAEKVRYVHSDKIVEQWKQMAPAKMMKRVLKSALQQLDKLAVQLNYGSEGVSLFLGNPAAYVREFITDVSATFGICNRVMTPYPKQSIFKQTDEWIELGSE